MRAVLAGGLVVDGTGAEPTVATLVISGDRIESVGDYTPRPDDVIVDCTGRWVMPGMIDAHSHADGALFREDVQLALLRQGVTTVIGGQDGVSFAPGSGEYAASYFGALLGTHPRFTGGSVDKLLSTYDGAIAVNFGYLVPAGTVRHEVMGDVGGWATPEELEAMTNLVREGMADGALGLSSGLDYVPGIYSDAEELAALCVPVAEAGGLYLTHMRGGYEENSGAGTREVEEICLQTGVSAQITHFHGRAALVGELIDGMRSRGVDVTYDAYPYRRGCTLLGMLLLPVELLGLGASRATEILATGAGRAELEENWFPQLEARPDIGPDWAAHATFASIAADEYAWAMGETIAAAARRAGATPADFAMRVLAASGLAVSAVIEVVDQRPYADLAELFTHPAHVGGSDGIYIGAAPHPRGWGCFARFLAFFTVDRADYTPQQAAWHLAGHTAGRLGLAERGRLAPGSIADVIVVDPNTVRDNATYAHPTALATGIDDVFVNGVAVLADGTLTGALAGRGLRRSGGVVRDVP